MQSRIQQHLAMQWLESESRTRDAAKSVTKDFAHLVEVEVGLLCSDSEVGNLQMSI